VDDRTAKRRTAVWLILAVAAAVKIAVSGYVGYIAAAAAGAGQAVGGGSAASDGAALGFLTMIFGFAAGAATWAAITSRVQAWVLKPAPSRWGVRSATAAAIAAGTICVPMSFANRTWPVLTHRPGPVLQFMAMALAEGLAVFLVQKAMLLEPAWDDRHRL
jgi:hypothetical protein